MGFYSFYPPNGGGISINPSVGTNGLTAPTSSTQVAGEDPSGNLQPLQTNANGALITTSDPTVIEHVIVDSSALPAGAGTEAKQDDMIDILTDIDATLASPLAVTGPLTDTQLRATPVDVAVSNFPATQPVSGTVAVSNFPAVQDVNITNATLAVTGPLTDTQLRATPLDVITGGLTDAELRASPVAVSGTVTVNAGTDLNTSALALEITQSNMSAKLPASLGQKASAASMAVVIASDQSTVNILETPSASAVNALSSASSTAFSASLVVKASAGRLYQLTGYNSSSLGTFVQIHNTTSVPADGVVPIVIFYVPPQSNFSYDVTQGKYFSTGITLCVSSTGPTKTIAGSIAWFNAEYL